MNILLNLLVTAVLYLLIPFVIRVTYLKKKEIRKRTAIFILIGNGVLIYLVFVILFQLLGNSSVPGMSAPVLWSVIAYLAFMRGRVDGKKEENHEG